jgi:hypothetical protein
MSKYMQFEEIQHALTNLSTEQYQDAIEMIIGDVML